MHQVNRPVISQTSHHNVLQPAVPTTILVTIAMAPRCRPQHTVPSLLVEK